MTEENKSTIRMIREEIVGSQNLDRLDGLYTAGYRYHGGTFGDLEGPDAFKMLLGGMAAVLDGYHEVVLDQVAEGSKVVTRLGGGGNVVGELLGVNGQGRRMDTNAIVISEFAPDGKIAEEWVVADTFAMLKQISG